MKSRSTGALLAVGFVVLGTVGNLLVAQAFLPGARLPGAGSAQARPSLRARLPREYITEDGAQETAGWPRMLAGAVAVGLLLSIAGTSALAEEAATAAAAPAAASEVVPEYDGRSARSTEKVLQRKVRAEKKRKASASAPAADSAEADAPRAKAATSSGPVLPMPGQGRFDGNGDFVLPTGPRDLMIPILEDNMLRRPESPTNETFFDMGQDPAVRKAKLAFVIFGPGCLYLFFFITGSLGIL